MNDKLERYIEVILSVGTTIGAMYGAYSGCFSGHEAMVLVIAAIALYQSTSLAKIFRINGGNNEG